MDNQKMLQAMFAEATIGILVVNQSGVIIKSNPYANRLFGFEEGNLEGEKVEELMPQSFRKRHVQHRDNYYKKPTPRSMGANLDLYGLRKDGTEFPIQISLSYMQMEGTMYAIAYVSDDTIQKNMFVELQQSKASLDDAQRLAHIGNFEMNIETNKDLWSDEMYRIFGLEIGEEITFHKYFSHIHPDDKALVKKYHEEIKRTKKGVNFGYRIITSKGEIKFVEGKRDVQLNDKGEVARIFGSLQDVTEIIEARNISEDISKIVEESLNEIFIFDAESLNFIQVNKGARQNIGYSLKEMQKMTPVDIKPEYDKALFLELVEPLVNGNKAKLRFETTHQRKDKSTYPVDVHLQYVRMGTRPVFVAYINDATDRKEYERKIIEYSDHLEQKVEERTLELKKSEGKLLTALSKEKELGELKSRFVSMASHEFRTPLSSILSSANLISRYEQGDQQDKRMKHVNRIESSVRNLTTILNDFLSLEKLESGKVRFNPVEVNINDYLQQIIEEVKPTLKTGQEIRTQHSGDETVHIDEHLLKNVLLNLLSNAIKYSLENKSIEINSVHTYGQLKIAIKDQGMGIPEDEQKHMFTRFFRANNVTNIQGTGLGLTIVKRYLDLMKGKITFVSKSNEGSTFTTIIPQ